MRINFKHIKIENFKNIGLLETDFLDKTIVSGANETGKTTFADAIFYVLTGKSSLGDSQFNIIPIGNVGVSPKVELTVEIEDNGENRTTVLAREYKAKQNRAREFDGTYHTICYIGGLKVGVKEFENWITEHICNAEVFRLITDTRFFTENIATNGREKAWEAQRRLLFNLCMIPHDEELVRSDERYKDILDGVVNSYGLSNCLRVYRQNERYIEGDIRKVNLQIESAKFNSDDSTDCDVTAIDSEIANTKKEISELEQKNREYREGQEKQNKNLIAKEYSELAGKLGDLEEKFAIEKGKWKDKQSELSVIISESYHNCEKLESDLIDISCKVNGTNNDIERAKRLELVSCHTCGQYITEECLNERLNKLIEDKEDIENTLRNLLDELKKKEKERDNICDNPPVEPKEIAEIKEKMKQLISKQRSIIDLENYEADRDKLYGKIAELQEKRATALVSIGFSNTVNLCKEELKKLVAERADIRRKIDLCKELIDKKCDMITDKVNSMFNGVRFEFFEKNKTNDEIRDCCNIYFNGVPYESLSYSTKFFAGLQIALGFQKMCKVSMPVVIDNAESIDIGMDIPVQSIMLVKKQEKCPNCGGIKHSRKNEDGNWTCFECGEKFKKTLEIEL